MADPLETRLEEAASDPRRQWGWGPSALASNEELDAWRVLEGKTPRDLRNDPAYREWAYTEGGYPKSRRAIRMQEEWDKRQNQMLEQQRLAQQMDLEQKKYGLQLAEEQRRVRDQGLEIEKMQLAEDRENRVQEEAKFIFNSIRGGIPIGENRFSEPIRPTDDNALERIANLMSSQYGMENPAARDAVMMLYRDALQAQESKANDAKSEMDWLIRQQEEASALNIDTTKFITKDEETQKEKVDQLGLAKAIGEAKRREAQEKEKQIKEAKIADDVKAEARGVLSEINKIDANIREENFKASRQKNATLRQAHIDNIDFLRSERDVLTQRFNSIIPSAGGATLKFNTPAEAEAANLPKGTIVEIGGRRARID